MSPSFGKSVLISGIGIAGATLAYWLHQYGFRPTLIERAPRLRDGGYIIDFWGRGYDIAEQMGLLPALQAEGYVVRELRIVDGAGRRVGGFGVDVFRELTGGRYLSIPRSGLAKLIYRTIENDVETIFGDSITRIVHDDDDEVHVEFEHAPARRFDIVVGADGLHSGVRRLVFGEQNQFEKFLGYTVCAFEVDGYQNRDDGVYVSYGAPGRQAARFAMRNGRTLFLLVFASGRLPRIEERIAQQEVLKATFGDAGWECSKILAAMQNAPDIYLDSVSQIRMEEWWRGRVVLIGDAAACPSLLAGQGSALAMMAAYILAGELSRAPAPEIAFRRYQELLWPFLTAKQKAAERFAGSFAPRTRFGLFLRNQITKTFAIPYLGTLALGPVVRDRMDLPDYRTAGR
ncbi:MAG: FAD-binding domain [Xanthobacteraceae bacterium]